MVEGSFEGYLFEEDDDEPLTQINRTEVAPSGVAAAGGDVVCARGKRRTATGFAIEKTGGKLSIINNQ